MEVLHKRLVLLGAQTIPRLTHVPEIFPTAEGAGQL
jgi:hypothetical protein